MLQQGTTDEVAKSSEKERGKVQADSHEVLVEHGLARYVTYLMLK